MTAPKKSPKLTAAKTRSLPPSSFALPGKGKATVKGAAGAYQIDTPGRARNALARGAQNASPAEQATIRRNVAKKYPKIKVAQPGKKK
jgi:hypothetical protein